MVRTSPRLAKDMNVEEESELQRLEGQLVPLASLAATGDAAVVQPDGGSVAAAEGEAERESGLLMVAEIDDKARADADTDGPAVVQGAAQRRDQLESKMFSKGGFRDSTKIVGMLTH